MLWCHIPIGTGGTVIWMKPQGEPGGVTVHPLCSSVLHVGVQPSSPDTTLTCRVWRDLEERIPSIDLASMCWSRGDSTSPGCWTTVTAVVLLAAYATTLEFPQVPLRHCP